MATNALVALPAALPIAGASLAKLAGRSTPAPRPLPSVRWLYSR